MKNEVLWDAAYDRYGEFGWGKMEKALSLNSSERYSLVCFLHYDRDPFDKKGKLKDLCARVASALGRPPEELFPRVAYEEALAARPKKKKAVQLKPDLAFCSRDWFGGKISAVLCPDLQFEKEEAHTELRKRIVAVAEEKLTPREKKVFFLRYGFDSPCYKRKEVAKRLSISSERVRQLENNALSKLEKNLKMVNTGT